MCTARLLVCAGHDQGTNALGQPTAAARPTERVGQIGLFVIRAYGDQARFIDAEAPPQSPLNTEGFTDNQVDLRLAAVDAPSSVTGFF